ncbi:MAG TPA: hypothetical protein GX505_13215 [Clostridiales bacterium]|nr:hypothetical protein [Clostridiales bacterium]
MEKLLATFFKKYLQKTNTGFGESSLIKLTVNKNTDNCTISPIKERVMSVSL